MTNTSNQNDQTFWNKAFSTKKDNSIKLIPFQTLAEDFTNNIPQLGVDMARVTATNRFIEQEQLNQKLSWLGYQMLAEFGSWKVGYLDNRPCAKATLDINTRACNNRYNLGLAILAKAPRQELFKNQKIVKQYTNILNPLVPIILAGFKANQNINYEDWHKDTIQYFLSEDQFAIYNSRSDPAITLDNSRLQELQLTALTVMSGKQCGSVRNAKTSYTLNQLNRSELSNLPRLAQHILLQTWAAHPLNRSPYAIQSIENWDVAKPELINSRILVNPDVYDYWQA